MEWLNLYKISRRGEISTDEAWSWRLEEDNFAVVEKLIMIMISWPYKFTKINWTISTLDKFYVGQTLQWVFKSHCFKVVLKIKITK